MKRSNRQAYHRKKVFVDRRVQGALVRQTLLQWSWYAIAVFAVLYLFDLVANGLATPLSEHAGPFWDRYALLLLIVVSLVPALVLSMIKMSHRFVGPILRLRRELRNLAAGEKIESLRFRENDFWQDLAVDLNAIAERMGLLAAEDKVSEPSEKDAALPGAAEAKQWPMARDESTTAQAPPQPSTYA